MKLCCSFQRWLLVLASLFGVVAVGRAEAGIFRDHVTPHWFAGADGATNQFWYRVDLPDGKRQIVTVNALTGERTTTTNASQADDVLTPLDRPHPSGNSATATEIRFVNRLDAAVELFWIDYSGGRVSYGRIAPGGEKLQHTYARHVWLMVATGRPGSAAFEAQGCKS